eukprot:scaffold1311_cov256-Pinguiococcus_pyrenoidosus.AAC.43
MAGLTSASDVLSTSYELAFRDGQRRLPVPLVCLAVLWAPELHSRSAALSSGLAGPFRRFAFSMFVLQFLNSVAKNYSVFFGKGPLNSAAYWLLRAGDNVLCDILGLVMAWLLQRLLSDAVNIPFSMSAVRWSKIVTATSLFGALYTYMFEGEYRQGTFVGNVLTYYGVVLTCFPTVRTLRLFVVVKGTSVIIDFLLAMEFCFAAWGLFLFVMNTFVMPLGASSNMRNIEYIRLLLHGIFLAIVDERQALYTAQDEEDKEEDAEAQKHGGGAIQSVGKMK